MKNKIKGSITDRQIKILFVGILFLVIAILCFGYVGYRFIRHEKLRDQQIATLNEKISLLSAKVDSNKTVEWVDDGFNYLALGNSLTLHNECSYWWNEVGMAASDAEHDYYHIVKTYLEQKNENVISYAYNFSVWETQSADRDETLQFINNLLSDKIDLITIQLGENATDLNTIERDYESLISYVSEYAPNAKIIIVGDFWSRGERDNYKQQAASACNVSYVSLDGIKDNKDFQCGLNAVVYDRNGGEHIVEHDGVAAHPGDKGMQAIADSIIVEMNRLYNY